jgi:hypothetical protein
VQVIGGGRDLAYGQPMDDLSSLLRRAAEQAASYRGSLADRPVGARADPAAVQAAFAGPLPQEPTAPDKVLEELIAAAEDGLVATAGPRFFGFVIGGALPASRHLAPRAKAGCPPWRSGHPLYAYRRVSC